MKTLQEITKEIGEIEQAYQNTGNQTARQISLLKGIFEVLILVAYYQKLPVECPPTPPQSQKKK